MKTSNVQRSHNHALIAGWVEPGTAGTESGTGGSGGNVGEHENGAAVALVTGDVVVLASDGTVTTTTTAQDRRRAGVVLDDIAIGAFGPIAWAGPVDLISVVASVTAGDWAETSATAGDAQSNSSTTPSVGSFGMFTSSGTTPSIFLGGGLAAGATGGSGALPWFNVKDAAYGAVGDGTTDDTAAINLAIAALIAAGSGVLYIPASASAYKITAGLTTLSVPCTVMGDGWMTGASGSVSRISFTSTTATLFTVSANGCTFRDLAMLQTGGTATAGAAITTTGGILADFDHLLFDGFWIGIDIENSILWSARRCYFSTARKYAIKVRNTAAPDSGDWTITECGFSNSVAADAAIRVESSGGGRIVNNKFVGTASGATRFVGAIDVAMATGVQTSVLVIEGNSIENMTGDAIKIATTGTGFYGHVTITGNQFGIYGNNAGFIVNLVAATNGTWPANGSIGNVIIDGNVAHTNGTARAAISLTNSDRVTIGDLQISGFNARYTSSGATNTTDTAAAAGSVATDAIWDAAGDLAVGTGADTAAKLVKGNAGAQLSMGNGAVIWNAGTSFPASKATNDVYRRTDLAADFFWDGTRWLSTQLFRDTFGVGNVLPPDTIATAIGRLTPWATDFDLWLEHWSISTYVATTNNGTNYWTVVINQVAVNDATTSLDSFATSGDTVNNWTQRRRAISAVYTAASYRLLSVNTALTLAPGGMYFTNIALEYRLIAT